jgi:hypothetical protein
MDRTLPGIPGDALCQRITGCQMISGCQPIEGAERRSMVLMLSAAESPRERTGSSCARPGLQWWPEQELADPGQVEPSLDTGPCPDGQGGATCGPDTADGGEEGADADCVDERHSPEVNDQVQVGLYELGDEEAEADRGTEVEGADGAADHG